MAYLKEIIRKWHETINEISLVKLLLLNQYCNGNLSNYLRRNHLRELAAGTTTVMFFFRFCPCVAGIIFNGFVYILAVLLRSNFWYSVIKQPVLPSFDIYNFFFRENKFPKFTDTLSGIDGGFFPNDLFEGVLSVTILIL